MNHATDLVHLTERPGPSGDPSRLLRLALGENAAFSLVSGLVLTMGAAWLDDHLGPSSWLLLALGLGLIGYALLLGHERRGANVVPIGRLAVGADLAWVITAAVLIVGTDWLTAAGEIALAVVTAAVALLATAQAAGLRRLTTA